ncbi:MAG: carbon-nitrogen hydrolase family protein [Deltaproteobacteria bacterium]|nr:carbon-nitrogen hydrolase family protein [Deltaproteobacteria bacterium]
MDEVLTIGLLHLDVQHGKPEENRSALLSLAERAAFSGAQVILAPELAVSGYGFDSIAEAAPFAETLAGETLSALGRLAHHHGVYIGVGMAERDPATHILYNSACIVGPDGLLAAHHRKVASERRWACPGSPGTWNLFDTPWGRMGVLICSDAYYSLLPRSLARQGVDLLLIPANWPATGIDPRKVWRARALENGMGVVACNRTGLDRRMDCRTGPSYAVTATGTVLLDAVSESTTIWLVDYPLEGGRIPCRHRESLMAERRPGDFAAICLDVNGLEDFAGLWGLPEAGELNIRCVVPESQDHNTLVPLQSVNTDDDVPPTLFVFPRHASPVPIHALESFVRNRNRAIIASVDGLDGSASPYALVSPSGKTVLVPGSAFATGDFGPARIALVGSRLLRHPELAVALSKQGCDLLVAETERLDEDSRLLLGAKCLERAAVVAAAPDGAAIFEPPMGHAPWKETTLYGPGECAGRIHTGSWRSKRFQDRVDMGVLLRR